MNQVWNCISFEREREKEREREREREIKRIKLKTFSCPLHTFFKGAVRRL